MSLDMSADGDRYTLKAVNDLQFHEKSRFSLDMDVTHSRTSSGLSHSGSLEVTCGK